MYTLHRGVRTPRLPSFVLGVAPHVQFRIYRPEGAAREPGVDPPGVIFAHGGGGVLGRIDTHHHICSRLASWSGAVVFSVEYRMFPEVEGAVGAVDTFAVLRHVHSHARELGVCPERLCVAGDSAGGNIAATCALLARDARLPLALQLLVYPVVSVGEGALVCSSALRNADAPILSLRALCELGEMRTGGSLLVLPAYHESQGTARSFPPGAWEASRPPWSFRPTTTPSLTMPRSTCAPCGPPA